jgi:septal ring factor EnvC (AmiA/AmiB activator)
MSTVTENDLKDLKDLINQINHNIIELKLGQAEIKTRLEDWKPSIDKITDLSEKVGESILENQKLLLWQIMPLQFRFCVRVKFPIKKIEDYLYHL